MSTFGTKSLRPTLRYPDLHEVALAFGFAPQTLRVWYFKRVKRSQQLANRQRALRIRTIRKKIENP